MPRELIRGATTNLRC